MRYMGSKARFKDAIISEIHNIALITGSNTYVEPFAGGFNIVPDVRLANRHANDINHYVVALFNKLRESGTDGFPSNISELDWYEIKYNKDEYEDWLVGLAGIYASFNGRWFNDYGGNFKNSSGKPIERYNEGIRSLKREFKYKDKFKGIKVTSWDYRDIDIPDGAIVYCDPPYRGTTGYGVEFNHDEFDGWVRELSKRCVVIISEYEMPDDFVVLRELGKSGNTISAGQSDLGGREEKLFIYRGCYKFNELYNDSYIEF